MFAIDHGIGQSRNLLLFVPDSWIFKARLSWQRYKEYHIILPRYSTQLQANHLRIVRVLGEAEENNTDPRRTATFRPCRKALPCRTGPWGHYQPACNSKGTPESFAGFSKLWWLPKTSQLSSPVSPAQLPWSSLQGLWPVQAPPALLGCCTRRLSSTRAAFEISSPRNFRKLPPKELQHPWLLLCFTNFVTSSSLCPLHTALILLAFLRSSLSNYTVLINTEIKSQK